MSGLLGVLRHRKQTTWAPRFGLTCLDTSRPLASSAFRVCPKARPQGSLRWAGASCVDFAGPAPTAFTRGSPGAQTVRSLPATRETCV